jgi:uncharacterized protein with HEPN domain
VSKAARIPVYLQHMLEAIERASVYIAPFQSAADFASSTQALDAVVRNLEILGEAVNKINQVDSGYLQGHPGVPWQLMRAMRNKMIHDYFSVDPVVVWQTVRNDLPGLKAQIERLVLDN